MQEAYLMLRYSRTKEPRTDEDNLHDSEKEPRHQMTDTIINDDCFNVLPQIEDESIDMILCDLPYGVLDK